MKKKELQSIDYIKERADENLAKTKSVFLYRRELAIRFALRQKEFTQKIFNHSYSAITLRYIGIEQDIIDESYMNFYL